jgi:ABC-type multidrug transport system fused ATPase/permease subunit
VRGEIEFDGVDFAYPGRKATLIRVNLHIRAGETIALVGPNGAGKTALINLLLRFYEPRSGRISVDGFDVRSMENATLRRQIGIVPQMAMLFNGTIRDNIAFGALDPSEDQVDEAVRLAQASDFIAALPEGMDTVIGDRGARLSGGQRQRIALARALIKDPPILILDEATSMFDDEGEDRFIAACADSFKDRTVILIAHRPATLALADRVILVEQGSVREAGGPKRRATKSIA